MANQFINDIQKIYPFSQEEIDMLLHYLNKRFIAKGDFFLNMGQICRNLAHIDSGLMMHYNLSDGVEIPCNFSSEGEWMSNLKSFTSGIPSEVAIKAIEDTYIQEISAEHIQQLFKLQPKWLLFQNHLVQLVFFNIAQHNADLAMLDAKARYYKFMQEKPDLVNRVPQYYIAAYLGIKPQSLSRIRKEG